MLIWLEVQRRFCEISTSDPGMSVYVTLAGAPNEPLDASPRCQVGAWAVSVFDIPDGDRDRPNCAPDGGRREAGSTVPISASGGDLGNDSPNGGHWGAERIALLPCRRHSHFAKRIEASAD